MELTRTISFYTMCSSERVKFAWLIGDIESLQAIFEDQHIRHTGKTAA